MAVVANVDSDARKSGIKRRIPKITWFEVKLFPEAGVDVRDVVLPILAEILSVSINHRRGVVVDAGDLFLVDRHDDNHAVGFGDFLHEAHRWSIGNSFDRFVPACLLFSAEIWRR